MKGTTNILLALVSAFEVFHQLSHFIYFFNVTLGQRFIDYFFCVKIQSISILGLNALQITLTATSVDRLISTMVPFWLDFLQFEMIINQSVLLLLFIIYFWPFRYKKVNEIPSWKCAYLLVFGIITIGYGIFTVGYFVFNAAHYPGMYVPSLIFFFLNFHF